MAVMARVSPERSPIRARAPALVRLRALVTVADRLRSAAVARLSESPFTIRPESKRLPTWVRVIEPPLERLVKPATCTAVLARWAMVVPAVREAEPAATVAPSRIEPEASMARVPALTATESRLALPAVRLRLKAEPAPSSSPLAVSLKPWVATLAADIRIRLASTAPAKLTAPVASS